MESIVRVSRNNILRQSRHALRVASQRQEHGRRFASTFSSRGGRWTSRLVRFGLAGAAIYYYNTASIFADGPAHLAPSAETHRDAETYTTVETIAAQRKAQARASIAEEKPAQPELTDGSPQALEEEAAQQGAFNEETGEINWDCPCLGGMADGPCGEQFKAAFSCFVFSKEEPKGIDCIEHFKTMQNCFREHPDVYGSELEPDEEEDDPQQPETGVAHAVEVARERIDDTVEQVADNISSDVSAVAKETTSVTAEGATEKVGKSSIKKSAAKKSATPAATSSAAGDEGGELVPKKWHDSTS